jgi:hypothetical protein
MTIPPPPWWLFPLLLAIYIAFRFDPTAILR